MIRVVLCAHNGARFMEAQLASIMEQTRPVDIIHLFDFASTDGTLELARSLAARQAPNRPRLDVHRVGHAPGVTLSFFHAFARIEPECAEEDVVFLSDQDDVWHPDKAAVMLRRLDTERNDPGERLLLFHDVQICDEALRPLVNSHYLGRPFRLPEHIGRERLLIANPVIGHTIALTKPLLSLALASLRPKHYAMHDWALVLLAAHTGRLVYVDAQLGLYRQHEGNILGAAKRRSLGEYVFRARRLSRLVGRQVPAFEADLERAARLARLAEPAPILPGRGPLGWRLAVAFALRGHTLGHRLAAVFPLFRMISRPGTKAADRA